MQSGLGAAWEDAPEAVADPSTQVNEIEPDPEALLAALVPKAVEIEVVRAPLREARRPRVEHRDERLEPPGGRECVVAQEGGVARAHVLRGSLAHRVGVLQQAEAQHAEVRVAAVAVRVAAVAVRPPDVKPAPSPFPLSSPSCPPPSHFSLSFPSCLPSFLPCLFLFPESLLLSLLSFPTCLPSFPLPLFPLISSLLKPEVRRKGE